jgi:hypothetical protein
MTAPTFGPFFDERFPPGTRVRLVYRPSSNVDVRVVEIDAESCVFELTPGTPPWFADDEGDDHGHR